MRKFLVSARDGGLRRIRRRYASACNNYRQPHKRTGGQQEHSIPRGPDRHVPLHLLSGTLAEHFARHFVSAS